MQHPFEYTIQLIRNELRSRLSPSWRSIMLEGGTTSTGTTIFFHIFPNLSSPPDTTELSTKIQNQLRTSGYVSIVWRGRNFRNYRQSNDRESENQILQTQIISFRDILSPMVNFDTETFVDENGETIEIER